MVQDEQLKMALQMVGIHTDTYTRYVFSNIYEKVKELGGNMNIEDTINIEIEACIKFNLDYDTKKTLLS